MNKVDRDKIVKYRITRAKKTLSEVEILVQNKLWNTAINRIYYSCYYAVIALLHTKDIKTQTHNGVRQMFGLHFVKTGLIEKNSGRFYSRIFDKRLSSDYDDFIEYNKNDVVSMFIEAKEFVQNITVLIKKESAND